MARWLNALPSGAAGSNLDRAGSHENTHGDSLTPGRQNREARGLNTSSISLTCSRGSRPGSDAGFGERGTTKHGREKGTNGSRLAGARSGKFLALGHNRFATAMTLLTILACQPPRPGPSEHCPDAGVQEHGRLAEYVLVDLGMREGQVRCTSLERGDGRDQRR